MERELVTNTTWKPKSRWVTSVTISLEKSGKGKYKGKYSHEYYTPQTPEEEANLFKEYDQKWLDMIEVVLDHKEPDPSNLP